MHCLDPLKENSVAQILIESHEGLSRRSEMTNHCRPTDQAEGHPKPKDDKFEWHDEGINLVRIIILAGREQSDTELCVVPWLPQKQIDPIYARVYIDARIVRRQSKKKRRKKTKTSQKRQMIRSIGVAFALAIAAPASGLHHPPTAELSPAFC